MGPSARTTAEKPLETGQAHTEPCLRPRALDLVSQGVQPQAGREPSTDDHERRGGQGPQTPVQVRPDLLLEGPRDQECPDGRFDGGPVRTP
jgi:hypothetical protein